MWVLEKQSKSSTGLICSARLGGRKTKFFMGAMGGDHSKGGGGGYVRAQGMCEGRWDVRQAGMCNVGNLSKLLVSFRCSYVHKNSPCRKPRVLKVRRASRHLVPREGRELKSESTFKVSCLAQLKICGHGYCAAITFRKF